MLCIILLCGLLPYVALLPDVHGGRRLYVLTSPSPLSGVSQAVVTAPPLVSDVTAETNQS